MHRIFQIFEITRYFRRARDVDCGACNYRLVWSYRSRGRVISVKSNSGLLEALMELRPALLRFLVQRGASADEAEDVVQDLTLKLSGDAVQSVAQPRPYLYKMANNHFLLQRRTAARRERRDEAWVDVHSGDPPELDEQPSTEARLIAQEQLALFQRVLDRLPERTRIIFHAFRVEGVARPAIAADQGISVSAVEKHLARAYEAIVDARFRLDEESPVSRYLSNGGKRHGI